MTSRNIYTINKYVSRSLQIWPPLSRSVPLNSSAPAVAPNHWESSIITQPLPTAEKSWSWYCALIWRFLFQNQEEGISKVPKRKGGESVQCVYFMQCIRILLPAFFTAFSGAMCNGFMFRDSLFLVMPWYDFWDYAGILVLSPSIIHNFYFVKFIGALDLKIICMKLYN